MMWLWMESNIKVTSRNDLRALLSADAGTHSLHRFLGFAAQIACLGPISAYGFSV